MKQVTEELNLWACMHCETNSTISICHRQPWAGSVSSVLDWACENHWGNHMRANVLAQLKGGTKLKKMENFKFPSSVAWLCGVEGRQSTTLFETRGWTLLELKTGHALLFIGDWMTPTRPLPTGPTHSTGGSGLSLFYLYPEPILLSLRHLISSSFQYLILTDILVTYFSIHACLAWNQLSSSYPTSYIAVGWSLDEPHPFPGPTHSTRRRGVEGLWPWPWQGAGGEPGTWNIYYK